MTTLKERPTETLTAVAEPAAAVDAIPAAAAVAEPVAVAAPAAPPVVDISNVPETPAELLSQWRQPAPAQVAVAAPAVMPAPAVVINPPAAAPKPLRIARFAATLLRCWDAIVGPPMTDRERIRREIAQHHGHADTFRPRI